MNRLLQTLTVVLLLSSFTTLPEPTYYLNFKDGIIGSIISSFAQDENGVLFFGTDMGLMFYDGTSISSFNTNELDSFSRITDLCIQNNGAFWVCTNKGVFRVSLQSGTTEMFKLDDKLLSSLSAEYSIEISSEGIPFFLSNISGLYFFDGNSQAAGMTNLYVPDIPGGQIKSFACLSEGKLALLTLEGNVTIYNYEIKKAGETISINNFHESSFMLNRVKTMITDSETLWLFDNDGSFFRFGKKDQKLLEKGRLPSTEEISAFYTLDNGHSIIAIGASTLFDYYQGSFKRIAAFDGKCVSSIFEGRQGVLWVGCQGAQLYACCPSYRNFHKQECFSDSGDHTLVNCFYETPDGKVYAGTDNCGVLELSPDGPKEVLTVDNGLSHNNVTALVKGEDNIVFISSQAGIQTSRLTNNGFESIYSLLLGKEASAITYDKTMSVLYVAYFGSSVIDIYQLGMREGRPFIQSKSTLDISSGTGNEIIITSLLKTSEDILFVGTIGGDLLRVDLRGRKKRVVAEGQILDLRYDDVESILYASSASGLIILDVSGSDAVLRNKINRNTGLQDECIHSMLKDDRGIFWMATNNGLSTYDSSSGHISFYEEETIQSPIFGNHSAMKSSDGTLWFGGANGYNHFNPVDIHDRLFSPGIVITSLRTNYNTRYQYPFESNKTFKFGYKDNSFSISFSALEYINNERCHYYYMLKGYNKSWIDNGNLSVVNFSDVPYGKYEFWVKSTNGDGVECDNAESFKIVISPPLWLSVPFKCIYFILGCGLLLSVFLIRRKIRRKSEALCAEREEEHRKVEMFEAKLDFFASITHEFSTPLTLIMASGEHLEKNASVPSSMQKHVRIISDNSKRMQGLIQELLDFRRAGSYQSSHKYETINVGAMLFQVLEEFSDSLESRNVKVVADVPHDMWIISDYDAIQKVLYNLISNADKYTVSNGSLNINMRLIEKGLDASFRNSSSGIKKEDIPQVFNMFSVLDSFERQASKGRMHRNGIGLATVKNIIESLGGSISVSSEMGHYVQFDLFIPSATDKYCEKEVGEVNAISTKKDEKVSPVIRQTILLVEDDNDMRVAISDMLSSDYTVIAAEDVSDALEKLSIQTPDIVITDIYMPGANGFDLLRSMRASELLKNIPVIVMTGNPSIDNDIFGYDLKAEAIIRKPFSSKQMLSLINSILSRRIDLMQYYNSALCNTALFHGVVMDSRDKALFVAMVKKIEDNMSRPDFDIHSLANEMCLSEISLYRKIKKYFNVTTTGFVCIVKLNYAAVLLKTTDLYVSEILYKCGFNNESYFYKKFREYFGEPPIEYRNRMKESSSN